MKFIENLFARLHSYDIGVLILRLMVGILLLPHGILMAKNGTAFIEQSLINIGIPGFVAYLAYLGEIIAPIFLILGLWSRVSAFLIAISMIVGIFLVHPNELISIAKHGFALEINYLFLFGAVAIIFLGGGKFAVSK